MIYIVHGDDITKTRIAISNQLKKLNAPSKIEIVLDSTTLNIVNSQVNSQDLFGENPALIIDVSSTDKSTLEKLITIIKQAPQETIIMIFSSKSLPKTNVLIKASSELKAKIVEFDIFPEGNVFNFLDSLFSKNRKTTYKELQKLKNDQKDDFYTFSMILWELRNIAQIKFFSPSEQTLSPTVFNKSQNHAKLYTDQEITNLFEYLYKIDIGVKTGEISPELFLVLSIEEILKK